MGGTQHGRKCDLKARSEQAGRGAVKGRQAGRERLDGREGTSPPPGLRSPHPTLTSSDVANEVSGHVLVVDAAGRLVQHDISGGRSLPVGRTGGG